MCSGLAHGLSASFLVAAAGKGGGDGPSLLREPLAQRSTSYSTSSSSSGTSTSRSSSSCIFLRSLSGQSLPPLFGLAGARRKQPFEKACACSCSGNGEATPGPCCEGTQPAAAAGRAQSRHLLRRVLVSAPLLLAPGFHLWLPAGESAGGDPLHALLSSPAAFAAESKKPKRPLDEYDERKLLEQNRRIQKLNQVPPEFPGFIREGFEVKVVTGPGYKETSTGLLYYDIAPGAGELPSPGQQVVFHYTGYNESGRRVDSTYQKGRPAETRVGINGMIPGFEEGISSMRAGGIRRIVIPPDLGPPTGPSTFFSAKQYEVFDVELLTIKDCKRRTLGFYSDVVCE